MISNDRSSSHKKAQNHEMNCKKVYISAFFGVCNAAVSVPTM